MYSRRTIRNNFARRSPSCSHGPPRPPARPQNRAFHADCCPNLHSAALHTCIQPTHELSFSRRENRKNGFRFSGSSGRKKKARNDDRGPGVAEERLLIQKSVTLAYHVEVLPGGMIKLIRILPVTLSYKPALNRRDSVCISHRISRKPDGWGPLEVWAYFHVRGKHHEVYLANVMPGHPIRCNLFDEGKDYRIEIVTAGRLRAARIEKPWTFPAGFRMFPYFGGYNTAPQEISISVES